MTARLLAAWLVLGMISAAANAEALEGERWAQARGQAWGNEPTYPGIHQVPYEAPWSPDAPEAQSPDAYRDGAWTDESGYDGVYRFRGDPPPGSRRRSMHEGADGYRFRPLTGQEAERRAQTPGWRPLEPDRPDRGGSRPSSSGQPSGTGWGGAPGLMDALTPPPRTFGFESPPWP